MVVNLQTWLGALGTLALWLITGYVNIRSNEPQPAALVILLTCFALTAVRPRFAVLWIVLFAGAIPASYLLARALNIPIVDAPKDLHALLTTAIAIVPAAVGSALGFAARSLYSRGK